MKWYTVFNSRTKETDYRNIAPLPKMSDPAAKAFRRQRLDAQNGNIDGAVHVTVTPEDVLILRIVLTDRTDVYGRTIRCAEGLYGTSEDIRREWSEIVSLAAGLWQQEENWYDRIVHGEDIHLLKPEDAVHLLQASPEDITAAGIDDLIQFTDTIGSFTVDKAGAHRAQPSSFRGRRQWNPVQAKHRYKILCRVAKAEKQIWLEGVDCDSGRCLVQSTRMQQTKSGYSIGKLERSAEAIRSYMDGYGWRETK